MPQKITAGIVLYNPDIQRLEKNIAAIFPQVETIILIDNHSENLDEIKKFMKNNMVLIENGDNLGVAHALNQMMEYSYLHEYDWVITLDQDSICKADLIKNFSEFLCYDRVAMLAASIYDQNLGKIIIEDRYIIPKNCSSDKYQYVSRCITSGTLTNVTVWKKLGGFDEKMFIDYVDFDFSTTVIKNDYNIIKVHDAVLYHEIGKAKELKIGRLIGRNLSINNHSPLRTYYYAKNVLYFIRKHKKEIDCKSEIFYFFVWASLKLMFEKERCKKLRSIIKGLHDGMKMEV